jgi:hypothetical protein
VIQNLGGYQPGGSASALNLSTPTVVKPVGGTFWNINVNQIGSTPGYLYDANALPLAPGQTAVAGAVYPGPSNIILTIAPNSSSPGLLLADVPGAGPFPFSNGLVFMPPPDMSASIAYA